MASYQELLGTIAQQNVMINNLKMERNWLEEDNNLQRLTVIKYQEKIHEWEVYSKYRIEETSNELKEVKQAEEEARKLHNKAVEDFGTLKAKYRKLKTHYFALLDQIKEKKEELTYGINLGREMYKECMFYKTQYFALLHSYKQPTEGATITEMVPDIDMPAKDTALEVVLQNKRNTAPAEVYPQLVRCELHDIVKNAFKLQVPENYRPHNSEPVPMRNFVISANVSLNKCFIAPPEAQNLIPFEIPSIAKYTCGVTVQGQDKLPSLHRDADLMGYLLSPNLFRPTGLLAICARAENYPLEPPISTSSLSRPGASELPSAEIKTDSNEFELCEEIRKDKHGPELYERNSEDSGSCQPLESPNSNVSETAKRPANKKTGRGRRFFSWLRKYCCCSRPQTTD